MKLRVSCVGGSCGRCLDSKVFTLNHLSRKLKTNNSTKVHQDVSWGLHYKQSKISCSIKQSYENKRKFFQSVIRRNKMNAFYHEDLVTSTFPNLSFESKGHT